MIDYIINLKKGDIHSGRSVICKRCLEDPLTIDALKMLDDVKAAPKLGLVKKEVHEGALCCSRCGKIIEVATPHVSLTVLWDVNYEKLDNQIHTMCKECYSQDKKTQIIWQFLAKLGKNPPFRPTLTCGSAYRCATYQKGKSPYRCAHIGLVSENDGSTKLGCLRAHPVHWQIKSDRMMPVLFSGVKRKGKKGKGITLGTAAANVVQTYDPQILLKKMEKLIRKFKKAAQITKDPGIKVMLEAQTDMMRVLMGRI